MKTTIHLSLFTCALLELISPRKICELTKVTFLAAPPTISHRPHCFKYSSGTNTCNILLQCYLVPSLSFLSSFFLFLQKAFQLFTQKVLPHMKISMWKHQYILYLYSGEAAITCNILSVNFDNWSYQCKDNSSHFIINYWESSHNIHVIVTWYMIKLYDSCGFAV